MQGTQLIQLIGQNLSIGFDKNIVAENIDLSVNAGEVLVIAGPNGVGKSTLTKTLARQIQPTKGLVMVNKENIWHMTSKDFARKIAYVSQLQEETPNLTVNELVTLGRNPHQMWWQWQSSAEDQIAIEEALSSTGLSAFKNKMVANLSGGERQRVSIATALAQQPSFLILDEPTAFLDFKHQLELIALLQALQLKNIGIILVLHDLNLMKTLASNILLLKNNKNAPSSVHALGAINSVMQPEILEKVFDVSIGSAIDPASGRDFIFYDRL